MSTGATCPTVNIQSSSCTPKASELWIYTPRRINHFYPTKGCCDSDSSVFLLFLSLCLPDMSSKTGVRRLWSHDEDQVLRDEVEDQCIFPLHEFCNFSSIADGLMIVSQGTLKNWKTISEKIPGRTNKDCRKRWSKVCEPVNKGPWSSDENEVLKTAVSRHGYK